MDDLNLFKKNGDLDFSLPLGDSFSKTLSDFLEVAAQKTGFSREDSQAIAGKISCKLYGAVSASPTPQQVQIHLSHRPGLLCVKTEIASLSYCEEEQFKTRQPTSS